MTKIKKHLIFKFDKIKDFDKIVPKKDIEEVFGELYDVYNSLKNPRSKISKHLKKYFIIRLVTITESYLKDLAAHLIDDHELKINRLFQEGKITIPINDLENIKKKESTIGRMTAISFNFQNTEYINEFFSRILGLNFFDTFNEYGEIAVKQKTLSKEDVEHFQDNKKKFFEMFPLRHEIIHTMKTPYKIRRKPEYFWGFWEASFHFIILATNLAEDVREFKEDKLRSKELQNLFSKKIKEYSTN